MDKADLGDQLAASLEARLGPVTIDALKRLTGGASRETWSFDATAADGTSNSLILQRNRGGRTLGLTFDVEDRLLTAAQRAGVPIPEIIVDAAGCTGLGDGRITRRIDGEALGPRIVRGDEFAEVRPLLPNQMARALAAIHSIPLDEVEGLAAADSLAQIRMGLDLLGMVSPAFELAIRWLEEHRPKDARTAVVHGDFRIGNLLVDVTGLRAVLDWELAHVGDPIQDLGWLCQRAWRFGGQGVVGGIGDLGPFLEEYRSASGVDVGEEHVRWWIIAGTLQWGLICALQASRHLEGHVKSVELATIGRRVAENEHDLLDLLDVPPHPAGEPLPVTDHGRPTAQELLNAVREHLVDNVMPKLERGDAFTTRVATNALAMVERELGSVAPVAFTFDEAELAARIRSGEGLSDSDIATIRSTVTARIAVANPEWAGLQT